MYLYRLQTVAMLGLGGMLLATALFLSTSWAEDGLTADPYAFTRDMYQRGIASDLLELRYPGLTQKQRQELVDDLAVKWFLLQQLDQEQRRRERNAAAVDEWVRSLNKQRGSHER